MTIASSAIHWKDYLDNADIEKDISEVCVKCKRKQIRDSGKITVQCNGMLNLGDVLSKEEIDLLPLEELSLLETEMNPFKWAKDTFVKEDGTPLITDRYYQEMMVRCLHGATNVEMSNGSYKEIKDIAVGDSIVSFREKNRSFPVKYKVLNKWNNGIKDTYKIKLKNGDSVIATSNHEFYAYYRNGKTNQLFNVPSLTSGYTSIDKGLSVGDFLYVENKPKNFGSLNDDALAKILGYIVTDGYVRNDNTKRVVEFANIRKEYVDELKDLIFNRFGDTPTESFIASHTGNDGASRRDTWKISYRKNSGILNFLESIGVTSKETREHGILEFAFNFTEESLKGFLNRVISGDGCISNVYDKTLKRLVSTISISSGNISFLEKLRILIKRTGVLNQKVYKQHTNSLSVGLNIRKVDDIIALLGFTGTIFGKEEQSIIAFETAIKISSTRGSKGDRRKFSNIARVKIESIEYYGKEEVYDIEVDTRHNFIANGIITHNCSAKRKVFRCGRRTGKSFAMAILITEAILRNNDHRALVVTPFDVQAEEIFNLVKKLLNNVKGIPGNQIIERAVSSPTHFIQLKNGSRVRGFTTGSSGAGSVRGQGADEIFIDEIDYMTEKDFNAIMAILADAPDTKLTVASTPDGEKMLYKLSRTPTYKEFHFPTFVLPHYNDDLDRDLRDTTDDIGYVQEFMAEFGSSRSSVFQKIFISKALNNPNKIYAEDVQSNRNGYVVTLGCDWNHENVGTRICLSALDKNTKTISPISFDNVSKEGWTQTAAMDKIIDLNRVFVPDFIYVDEGFGYAQIEMLKKFALSKYGKTYAGDPDLRLANIVGINFSSSVKIVDPKTNQEKNRFIKQYMVENAVNFFEEGMISLDIERDVTLENELIGYVEKSRTPTGRIVYAASNSKIGDHNLDAFMLSLYAIHMEYSDLFKSNGMKASIVTIGGPEKVVESNRSAATVNKDLAYFSEPVKRLSYNRTSFDNGTHMPSRGGRTRSLISSRWNLNL